MEFQLTYKQEGEEDANNNYFFDLIMNIFVDKISILTFISNQSKVASRAWFSLLFMFQTFLFRF